MSETYFPKSGLQAVFPIKNCQLMYPKVYSERNKNKKSYSYRTENKNPKEIQ
jgi:hypothetical protein